MENEVPDGPGSNADSLDSPEAHNSRRATSLQKHQDCPSPAFNNCPQNSFLEKVISQQASSSSSSSSSLVEYKSADKFHSVQNLLKAAEHCNIKGQSQMPNIQSTLPCQKQVLASNSGHTAYQYGTTTQENILWDQRTIAAQFKMQTAPDSIPVEYSSMAHAGEFSKCTKHLSDVEVAQKASRCIHSSASDLNKASPSSKNIALHTVEAETYFQSHTETKHPNTPAKNSDNRPEKVILSQSSTLTLEPNKTSEGTLTHHIDLKRSNVRFLRGILKKEFKCIGDKDAKPSYTPGNFAFSKEVAIAIKDSLELCRSKGKDNTCIKKKLRWFDEVRIDGEENIKTVTTELSKLKETESRLPQPTQQPLVDQHSGLLRPLYLTIPRDLLMNNMTSFSPDDSKSTKQAWLDAGPKGKQQEFTGESRMEKAASCAPGHWVSPRAHSAKTGMGTISSQTRRGTRIRPQSPSQMQHVIRTQGKVLVPRPPPRPEVTTRTCNIDECFQDKACLPVEPVLYKDDPEGQPVPQCYILKRDESTRPAPMAPSYADMYETRSKGTPCHSNGQVGSGSNGFKKSIFERTPTDEEISLLWHGVRSALASKEGKTCIILTIILI